MAEGPKYAGSGASYAQTLARVQAIAEAESDLSRKVEQRTEVEERGTGVEEESVEVRSGLTDSTRALSAALSMNIEALNAETAAVLRNTQALEAKLAAVRQLSGATSELSGAQISSVRSTSASTDASLAGVSAVRRERSIPVVAPAAVENDARYRSALASQASAEREAKASSVAYAASIRPGAKAGVGDSAQLLQQREATTQTLAAAKAETAAARNAAVAQEQLAQLNTQAIEVSQQRNAALVLETKASQAAAAQAEAALQGAIVAQRTYGTQLLGSAQGVETSARLGAIGEGRVFGTGSATAREAGLGSSIDRGFVPFGLLPAAGETSDVEGVRQYARQQGHAYEYGAGGADYLAGPASPYERQPYRTTYTHTGTGELKSGTTTDPMAAGITGSDRELAEYDQTITQAQHNIGTLGEAELASNQAFQESSAVYANASSALSQHGAMTTEFIGALARGEVTLAEFGQQLTSTVGKFAGFAAAGAAVYGVYDALKHVVSGATDTQAGVQTLGRFIPGLGGPAGGGSGQVGHAESTLRDISTQFNQPISTVVDAMQVMARTFHNVASAGEAARAVLAATSLDQVPQTQSEQYLVGIGNSLGYTSGSQLVNVVNQLNALQAQYGARVSQTLPGLARAVPVASASGVSVNQLEALTALGVRGGVTGSQTGTALLRSIGSFAFRPGSATIFGQYGIKPQPGQAGDLFDQIIKYIDTQSKAGTLSGLALRNLATATGGPLLGTRSILPIFEQEALHPGLYNQALETTNHPRSYQEDLSAQLGSVSQRFKSIGISLENFGSQFASIGILTPIEGLLSVVQRLTSVFETFAGPISSVGHIFAELPAPMQQALGLFIAYKGASAFLNTSAGGRSLDYVGRLPGLGAVQDQPRSVVNSAVKRLNQDIIPSQISARQQAAGRYNAAASDQQDIIAERAAFINDPANQLPSGERYSDIAQDPVRSRQFATHGIDETGNVVGGFAQFSQRNAEYEAQQQAAAAEVARTQTEYASKNRAVLRSQAQLGNLSDKSVSYADRAKYGQSIGNISQGDDNKELEQIRGQEQAKLDAITKGVALQEESNSIAQEALSVQRTTVNAGTSLPGAGGIGAGEAAGAVVSTDAATLVTAKLTSDALVGIENDEPDVEGDVQTIEQAESSVGPGTGVLPVGGGVPVPGTASEPGEQAALAGTVASRAAVRGPGLETAVGDFEGDASPSLLSRATSGLGSAAAGIADSAGGNLPIAALLGSQLVGGIVPGQAGTDISSVGGSLGSGALIGSLLGHTGVGLALGAYSAAQGQAQKGGIAGLLGKVGLAGSLGFLGFKGGGRLGGWLAKTGVGQDIEDYGQGAVEQYGAGSAGEAAGYEDVNAATSIAPGESAAAGIEGATAEAVGDETALDETPAGPLIQGATALAGGTAAVIASILGGGKSKPKLSTSGRGVKAVQQAQDALSSGVGAPTAADAIGNQVTLSLGGSGGTSAQQQLSSEVNALQSEVIAGGTQSKVGQEAQSLLSSAVSSAVAQAGVNPTASSELLQSASSGKEAAYSNEFKFNLQQSSGVGGAEASAGPTEQQYESEVAPYTAGAQQAQAQLQQAEATFNAAMASGQKKRIDSAKQALTSAQNNADLAQGYATTASQAASVNNQQTADSSYGIASQDITAQGALAQANAGGNVQAQLRAQITAANQTAAAAQSTLGQYDPQTAQQDVENAQAQAQQAHTQSVVQGLTELKGKQAVTAAQVFTGDPIKQAQTALTSSQQQYQYIAKNAKSFDPSDLSNAFAAVIAAQQALADEVSQYDTELTQIVTQTQQAQEYGNQLAQAQTGLSGAAKQISEARTPLQKAQASEQYATAQGQYYAAQQAVISSQGGLAEAQASGNPVLQAQLTVQYAQAALAAAHGIDNVRQAETALDQANYSLNQAIQTQIVAIGALAASTTSNPLTQLKDQEAAYAKAAAQAASVGDISGKRSDITQLNQLKLNYQSTLIEQRESTTQFQLDMYQITYSQAIQQLEGLLKVKDITLAQKQQVEEQIRQLELSDSTPGQFDLGPSNAQVKLPTVYDILGASGGSKYQTPGGGLTAPGNQANLTSIANDVSALRRSLTGAGTTGGTGSSNYYLIDGSGSTQKVTADAIDRKLNSHVRARLRAAGLRGT